MRCVCLSIIMLFLGVLNTLYAQNFKVFDIKRIDTYTDSSFCNKSDNNGIPCAVIKVVTQERGIEFENTYLVDVEEFDGGYFVYMASGAKKIKIKHPNYLSINVDFSSFDISYLESGTQYELTLKCDNHNEEEMEKAMEAVKDSIEMLYLKTMRLDENEISAPIMMALKEDIRNNNNKAKFYVASLCQHENPQLSVKMITSILKTGDSICLNEMDCDLLLLYASSIPDKKLEKEVLDKMLEKKKPGFEEWYYHDLAPVALLLIQYDRALSLFHKAYTMGCHDAKSMSDKILSSINNIKQNTSWEDWDFYLYDDLLPLFVRLGFTEAWNKQSEIEELIKLFQ